MPQPQIDVPIISQVIEPALDMIIDQTTTAGSTYVCEAYPGTASSSALWRISRLSATGLRYANGNAGFVHIADNRASLSY